MTSRRSIIVSLILLAVILILPRIFSGTLLVKYDVLLIHSRGDGYAPTYVGMLAKLIALCLAVSAAYSAIKYKSGYPAAALLIAGSAAAFLTISHHPTNEDIINAAERGNILVEQIDSYYAKNGRYPDSLNDLPSVPTTGLVKERRFYYVSAESKNDDSGPWFPRTRPYLDDSPYIICVPLVPGGTLFYRPEIKYCDIQMENKPSHGGWYKTNED